MKLFRPVGAKEMDLIMNTGNRRFPARLPEQSIFYPVLNIDYAVQIARDWNAKDEKSGYVGFVLSFDVDDYYISKFEIQQAGSSIHQEYWIPAEELVIFNQNIQKNILIAEAYYGNDYTGKALINTTLQGKSYSEQLIYLKNLKESNIMEYTCEVLAQWKIISQNYFLWKENDYLFVNIQNIDKENLLMSMKKILKENLKWFIME